MRNPLLSFRGTRRKRVHARLRRAMAREPGIQRQALRSNVDSGSRAFARVRNDRGTVWELAKASVVAATLAAALASAAGAQQNAPLTKVRMAYDGYSMTSAPLNYAVQQGIFKRFGLDLTPSLHRGRLDADAGRSSAARSTSRRTATRRRSPPPSRAPTSSIIGGIANTLPYQLVVQAAITNAEQLKGKNVAISRYGSSTDAAADFALKHLGFTRKDVNILQLGGAATRMAAAISGRVDGTFEQYPDTAEMTRHGFHVLVDLNDVVRDYPNTSFVTSRAFLKSNRDTVKKFLMAMATAVDELKRNPDIAIKQTQAFLKAKDEANVRAAYELLHQDLSRPAGDFDQGHRRGAGDAGPEGAEGQGVHARAGGRPLAAGRDSSAKASSRSCSDRELERCRDAPAPAQARGSRRSRSPIGTSG